MSNKYNNYSVLGNDCKYQSIAITSNTKFIPPLSNIYFLPYTKSALLPGEDGIVQQTIDSNDQVADKVYDKKDVSNKETDTCSCKT